MLYKFTTLVSFAIAGAASTMVQAQLEQLEQLQMQREALAAERRAQKAARDAARRARRRSKKHPATSDPSLQHEFEPEERAAPVQVFSAPRVFGREGPAAPAA